LPALATAGSLPATRAAGFAATSLACLGLTFGATAFAAGLPLAAGLAVALTRTFGLAPGFFAALATVLRTGFFGAAFRLAGFALAVFFAAGLAGRLPLGLAALRAAGLGLRGLDLGLALDFAGDLRVGFAGFLTMVVLDECGCGRRAF